MLQSSYVVRPGVSVGALRRAAYFPTILYRTAIERVRRIRRKPVASYGLAVSSALFALDVAVVVALACAFEFATPEQVRIASVRYAVVRHRGGCRLALDKTPLA